MKAQVIDQLLCKWLPRKSKIINGKNFTKDLIEFLSFSPKRYRKTLVTNTKVVESLMCANDWENINFSHVPSQASRIYSKAFRRHDSDRYQQYLDSVMKGEAKMNASSVFPHEVVMQLGRDSEQASAQWKNLPDYLEGTDEKILTVCDVSGSMSGLPMEVSIALGLYFSERLTGTFKDCFVTFSETPEFSKVSGETLFDRYLSVKRSKWGYSTDFIRVFTTLLDVANRDNIPEEDMPTKILVISDMQFNEAGNIRGFDKVVDLYEKAGYTVPQLVFWNVASRDFGNVPIKQNEEGVALVSGASPAVIKSVLGGKVNPIQVMLDTVMKERYNLS